MGLRAWIAQDCLPIARRGSFLHVRPDCFVTMDYFLLLCSFLLPVGSAVEGKEARLHSGQWCGSGCFKRPDHHHRTPLPFPSLPSRGRQLIQYSNSSSHCDLRVKTSKQPSVLGLKASLALRSNALGSAQLSIHDCYARPPELICV